MDHASHTRLAVVAIAIFLASCAIAVNRLYFHPLSKIPGPKLWIISRLPFLYNIQTGYMALRLKQLHEQYGPVVRTAVDEVSFASEEAWTAFYAYRQGSALPKNPVWHHPRISNGRTGIMSASPTDHSRFRRTLAPAFTVKALKARETVFQRHVNILVSNLQEEADGSSTVDLVDWFDYTSIDIVSEFSLGRSFNTLTNAENRHYVPTVHKFLEAFTRSVIPILLNVRNLWAYLIPRHSKEQFMAYSQHLNRWTHERFNRGEIEGTSDLMTYISSRVKEKGLAFDEMENSIGDIMIAGSETVSTTCASVCYQLIENPTVHEALTREIRASFKNPEAITSEAVEKLDLLDAVIKEAMRLCPSLPMMLPRIMTAPGADVNGYWIPPGTYVSICQLAAYLSATNFAYPTKFLPDRWLTKSDIKLEPHNEQIFHPFSVGPRDCVGKSLGLLEARLILAKLLWQFDVRKGEDSWDWYSQKSFHVWAKRPLNVKLESVHR